jgi:propionate catabolism regulator PrpR
MKQFVFIVASLKQECAMNDRPFHVGFIAASDQFFVSASKVTRGTNIQTSFSNIALDDSIPAGLAMEQDGVEVIISRRGTANILRENLSVPVLAVRISVFDILENVQDACRLGSKILLTSFREELSRVEIFQDFFGINIVPGVFHDSESLRAAICKGREGGCDVVIGGGLSMAIARELGLNGVELKTTEDVMKAALEDALSVAKFKRLEQEKTTRLRTIMNATSEGIISVDRNGSVTTINQAALDLLKINGEFIQGRPIQTCIPGDSVASVLQSEQPLWDNLEKIRGEMFVMNHVPLKVGNNLVGAVTTFRDASNVMQVENKVRRSLVKRLNAKYTFEDLIYRSPKMKDTLSKAMKYARTDSSILVTGETGTGKELMAQGIHHACSRQKGPFVSINCAAVPDQLLESELFGHEEGAFTGSRKGGRPGLFELAHHGTIFLDEIGSTPLNLQSRLLRVLQEKEVMRVGGDRLIPIDVRVVSATNQSLSQKVQTGHFREDLFFRLDVLTINIPPLRERTDDIPILVRDMVAKASGKHRLPSIAIPDHDLERLTTLQWPGNVRQLYNFIEKLVILCQGRFAQHIFEELHADLIEYSKLRQEHSISGDSWQAGLQKSLVSHEAEAILRALKECRYSKSRAAEQLGISRTTLWRKMKEHHIS